MSFQIGEIRVERWGIFLKFLARSRGLLGTYVSSFKYVWTGSTYQVSITALISPIPVIFKFNCQGLTCYGHLPLMSSKLLQERYGKHRKGIFSMPVERHFNHTFPGIGDSIVPFIWALIRFLRWVSSLRAFQWANEKGRNSHLCSILWSYFDDVIWRWSSSL